VTRKYKGKQKQNKNVIILTRMNTGSAADRFVSDMKKNNMATVIGNNTGGEGLASSYNMVSLPNSKLAFIYMPGGAKNPDGTDNSLYGTAPDYYVTQSVEDYYAECEKDTDKAFDYTEDYEYDTVLRYAVDVMKGK
jgi:C-terminal processing protease CtpA/Prc